VIDGAHAQSPGSEEAPAGRVDLDRLLKLPETLDFDVERRGGRTRREWLALFGEVQRSVDEAREGLADAQARLAAMAGRSDNWNMAPPGLPIEAAEDNPDTRGLREEVARRRAEITRAEARQREVQIEASLAGVPEDWRRPQAQIGSENRSPRRDDSAP
jgi:hypothetical protein